MKFLKFYLLLLILVSCQKKDELSNQEVYQKRSVFHKAVLKPSEIDSLNSEKEIELYIQKKDTNYKKFELRAIQNFDRSISKTQDSLVKLIAKRLQIKSSFFKADLDNNGLTDLLAIGDNHTCITSSDDGKSEVSCDFTAIVLMNFDNGKSEITNLISHLSSIVPQIEFPKSEPLLVIYYPKKVKGIMQKAEPEKRVPLKYMFQSFIEYNQHPKIYNIKKIEYSTSTCFGTCPEFDLIINKDRTASFAAKKFNFHDDINDWSEKEEGRFKGKINEKEFNNLISLLNYIDFPTLKNQYSVTWRDDQGCNLKITYDNGKTKVIGDYGLIGTRGLQRVYGMLFELRKNQVWK